MLSEEKIKLIRNAAKWYGNSLPEADERGHRTRSSDSSLYDEVCLLCGAKDHAIGGNSIINRYCYNPVTDEEVAEYFEKHHE